jgi:hypothetical protein
MEGYFSTGQSLQRAVVPMEEEEEEEEEEVCVCVCVCVCYFDLCPALCCKV